MMAQLQSSKEIKVEQRMCDLCKEEGETNTGLKFCLDCKEVLCRTCTKYHRRVKALKEHIIVYVSEMPIESYSADIVKEIGKCTNHPDREVEVYCKTHDDVLCAICLISGHISCEMIAIACHETNATKLETDSEMLISRMEAAIDHCNVLNKLREGHNSKLQQDLKQINECATQARDEVVHHMDNLVKIVAHTTNTIQIDRKKTLDADMSQVTKLKELTEDHAATVRLATSQPFMSEKRKFLLTHKIKKQFEETFDQISVEDHSVSLPQVKMVLSDSIKKLTRSGSADEAMLFKMECSESFSRHTPLASLSPVQTDDGTVPNFLTYGELVNAEDHTVRPPNGHEPLCSGMPIDVNENVSSHVPLASVSPPRDTGAAPNFLRYHELVQADQHTVRPMLAYEPWCYGIATHKDGRVILTDYRSEDRNFLCLYNPTKMTTQTIFLKSFAFSAAQIDETHIAISGHFNKTITIVNAADELRVKKTFRTEYEPKGIVALKSGELAVACNPPAVVVIDVSGTEVVQKLYLDQDTYGRKFESFKYLAVDEMRGHVILSCTAEKAVYCFDLKGIPVFKYTHPRLTSPRGVALDKCGNIYVCEHNSPGGIHKLSPTGEPISVMTNGVPPYPMAICSDVTDTGFWVSCVSVSCEEPAITHLSLG